ASAPATAAPQPAALLEDVCAASRDRGLAAGLTRVVASGCAVPGTPASRRLVPARAVEPVRRWRPPAGTLTARDVPATPPPSGPAALHARPTAPDWSVTPMFGAGGYLRTHPVSCLCAAGLAADTWVGAGPPGW